MLGVKSNYELYTVHTALHSSMHTSLHITPKTTLHSMGENCNVGRLRQVKLSILYYFKQHQEMKPVK